MGFLRDARSVAIGSLQVGHAYGGKILVLQMQDAEFEVNEATHSWIAHEPLLVPTRLMMRAEGVNNLEEWYRWAEEWSVLLRIYGGLARDSKVLEIGCGSGRIAFALRYLLHGAGTYDGFEICRSKVEFLEQNFQPTHPNFRFIWADIENPYHNTSGAIKGSNYRFPFADHSFDVVYAASVFTHLLPDAAENYFRETFRVLKPNGKAVFSFFLLDNYRRDQPRPMSFNNPVFNFDHSFGLCGNGFAISVPLEPEYMTSYSLRLLKTLAAEARLVISQPPIPGLWSGTHAHSIGAQDVVVFTRGAK